MAETMTKVNKGISLLFALVLAMFMCAPALTAVANADEDYYMTWSQYKEANGTEGITVANSRFRELATGRIDKREPLKIGLTERN